MAISLLKLLIRPKSLYEKISEYTSLVGWMKEKSGVINQLSFPRRHFLTNGISLRLGEVQKKICERSLQALLLSTADPPPNSEEIEVEAESVQGTVVVGKNSKHYLPLIILPKISGFSCRPRLDSSYNMKLVRISRNLQMVNEFPF